MSFLVLKSSCGERERERELVACFNSISFLSSRGVSALCVSSLWWRVLVCDSLFPVTFTCFMVK